MATLRQPSDQSRLVVEDDRGVLHIFSERNLRSGKPMTEQEWMTSSDSRAMLEYLRCRNLDMVGSTSDRKLRLFCHAALTACGCGPFADEYIVANISPLTWAQSCVGGPHPQSLLGEHPQAAKADLLRHLVGNPWRPVRIGGRSDIVFKARPKGSEAQRWQALHLDVCEPLPAVILSLAQALYDGQDCAHALHDALLEAEQGELADHFWHRRNSSHPKGCWALDCILGKE